MIIVGVNKGSTVSGKSLRHGGAAMVKDGKILAVSEERVTRSKYAGGYSSALPAILDASGTSLADVDHLLVSTCCESESAALLGHELSGDPRLASVNHHFSHAALSFMSSGYDRALVAVVDGGGNVLDDPLSETAEWWTKPREQVSLYIGEQGAGIRLLARELSAPFDVGLGEIYRAFTYWLGWHSSTHASKTMALAGHGRRGAFKKELYHVDSSAESVLKIPIENNPSDPIGMILSLGDALGIDFGEPRAPGDAILQVHRDVAAFVQEGVESALLRILSRLKSEHKLAKLCIAGGFALNVVVNGRLMEGGLNRWLRHRV